MPNSRKGLTFKVGPFAKTVEGFSRSLIILARSFILDVWLGFEYVSDKSRVIYLLS